MASQSDNPYDPLAGDDFEAFIEKTLEDTKSPGVAIAVVKGDQTWSGGWGVADLATKEPVTPHTLFLTCSNTKSFTASLVAKLVHGKEKNVYGDIKWSTKIADLIKDDFVLQDEYATNHITLEDALSHRTGMPRHDLSWINGDPSLKEMTRSLRHLRMHNEIRTTFEYCNLMYHTIAHLLESVTNRTMGELLRTWLWEPLGMNQSVWTLQDAHDLVKQSDGKINMARGHQYDSKSDSQYETPWSTLPPSNGAGGIISNVLDYAKWIRQFLHPDEVLLPAAAIKDLASPRMPNASRPPHTGPTWYGLGLDSAIYRGKLITSHRGALAGYMSKMLWIPEMDWGCVVMTNSYALASETVAWYLIDDFLGTQGPERYDAASAMRGFLDRMAEESRTARDQLFPSAPPVGKPDLYPALPLGAYEGTYRHPAYNTITVAVPNEDRDEVAAEAGSEREKAAIMLVGAPAKKSFLDLRLTFEHINGEHWLARQQSGPGGISDSSGKARFEIAPAGNVSGLWLQAER